jgi:hypothetical protein
MKLFNFIKRKLGMEVKNKYARGEVKSADGNVQAYRLIDEGEKLTLPQRLERYREWQAGQGL